MSRGPQVKGKGGILPSHRVPYKKTGIPKKKTEKIRGFGAVFAAIVTIGMEKNQVLKQRTREAATWTHQTHVQR